MQSIEDAGLVERRPNPADGQSVIVRHTDAGRQILLDAIDVMTAIEHDYAAALGAEDLESLKALLARLNDQVDPQGKLAAE